MEAVLADLYDALRWLTATMSLERNVPSDLGHVGFLNVFHNAVWWMMLCIIQRMIWCQECFWQMFDWWFKNLDHTQEPHMLYLTSYNGSKTKHSTRPANTISFTSKAARSQEPHVILRRVQEPSIPQDQQIQSVLHQKQLEVKNHMLHLQEFKNQAVHKSSKYNQFYAWSSYRSQEPHVTLTRVQEPSIPHVILKFLRCWRTKHSTRITTSHRKTSNSSWKLTPRGAVEASNNVLMKNNVSTPDPQNWLTTCWLSMPGGLWVFRKSRLSQL